MTLQNTHDMTLCGQVLSEALRLRPVVVNGSQQTLAKDKKIRKYYLKAGDIV